MMQPIAQSCETHTIVEQYATEVLDFSSQYGADSSFSYTAANCLGVPTKFPKYGDFSPTFVMKDFGHWWGDLDHHADHCKTDTSSYDNFIDLKYEHSVYVYAVYVYETFNPGAIIAIYGGNCRGDWSRLWLGPVQKIGHQPRVFSPPIKLADFPVNQIRIVFNQRHLPYYTEIDAVALLGTLEPSTKEARLLSSMSLKPMGPILKAVIKQKLYRCITETFDDILELNELLVDNDIGRQCQVESEIRSSGPSSSEYGYFTRLPDEIVQQVFGFLDFISLVQCNQVCRLFRRIASDSMLYTKVNLRPLFHVASNDTMKFVCNKAQHLQEFDSSWCGNYGKISPHVLKSFLIARGNNLVKLNLANCHVLACNVNFVLSQSCPNLEDLNLSNCQMSHSLHFHPMDFSIWKKLKRLNLYRTQVSTNELRHAVENCTELEYLNAGACCQIDADVVASCLAKSKTLKSLDLWRVNSLTARGVFSLSHIESLQHLDVGWCSNVDANTGCFVALLSSCKRLSRFFAPAQRQVSDRDIFAIRDNLSNTIEQLSVMGTRNVSRDAMLSLARALTSIKLLDVGYCEQLEGAEFLSQLRAILPGCHVVTSFNQE